LIWEILALCFIALTAVMMTYLVRHYIFTLTVLRNANRTAKTSAVGTGSFEPTVSILIPAHNEERVIGRLLQRLTELTYPQSKLQVIVVDDASSDGTGAIADEYSRKHPFIRALHRTKQNGAKGKASAMNDGFKLATGEITLCFDADYYPQKDIVEKLTAGFVSPEIGAVQGRVVVLNEPQNLVTRLVALERISGYRVDQEARDNLGLIAQFGGTVGGFRTSLLKSLGGWAEDILAEDTDLTFRVYLAGYKIKYVVNAECYEEAVDNWKAYRQQRFRWAKGHMQCFFKHSLSVLTSRTLTLKEKIDGLLLLNVYFMPIIAIASLIVGLPLIFMGFSLVDTFWLWVPISLYSFVGNFAPFFEVGVGVHLDGRTRTQWLIPVLIVTFLYNFPICTRAFFEVLFSKLTGRSRNVWVKTHHSGNGKNYIGS
jgi:cellulose synthase/poly-beta-1,6-N-acetylglucosamine synthase-like glycosyltransferase